MSEYGHVAYQIKAEDTGSNMVANILPTDTPLIKGVGSKGQTIYFSESSHVAYQIKAEDAGSNMVANILPTETPSFFFLSNGNFCHRFLSSYWSQCFQILCTPSGRERSGSVVECLTRYGGATGSSLTGVTALWSLSKTHLS